VPTSRMRTGCPRKVVEQLALGPEAGSAAQRSPASGPGLVEWGLGTEPVARTEGTREAAESAADPPGAIQRPRPRTRRHHSEYCPPLPASWESCTLVRVTDPERVAQGRSEGRRVEERLSRVPGQPAEASVQQKAGCLGLEREEGGAASARVRVDVPLASVPERCRTPQRGLGVRVAARRVETLPARRVEKLPNLPWPGRERPACSAGSGRASRAVRPRRPSDGRRTDMEKLAFVMPLVT
jgi:hypothetical protein